MRVLVTGGNGFLGKRVLNRLGFDSITFWAPTSEQCDFLNPLDTYRAFESFNPSHVIHLAGQVGGIAKNLKEPGTLYYKNLMLGVNIVETASKFDVEKVVYAGSACSYPYDASLPLMEDDLFNGLPEGSNAPYGLAKRAILSMAQSYRAEKGLGMAYLVLANLYGPGQDDDPETSHFVPAVVRKMREAREQEKAMVTVWGDGTPTRDLLFVDDAADAIVIALKEYESEDPINIGTGEEHTISEVVNLIKDICGYGGALFWDDKKPNGQPRRVLSINRMKDRLGWLPDVDLISGLRRTIWNG